MQAGGREQHGRAAQRGQRHATASVPRTPQRHAASTARPSSSAAMLDCEKLVTRPAEQPQQHRGADHHVAPREPHSTTVVTAIITSARKRP